MGIKNILLLILGYVLLLVSTKLVNAGGISAMRKKATKPGKTALKTAKKLSPV